MKPIACIFFILLLQLQACSDDATDLTFDEALILKMYAVYETPEGAEGSYEPKWQDYTLNDVYLTPFGATESLSLLEDDPFDVRIVERSQIIFTADLTDYVEDTFSDLTVVFDSTVKATTKFAIDEEMTWDEPTLSLAKEFTVEKGKEIPIYIEVRWRNTVTRDDEASSDSVVMPAITISDEDE